MIKVQITTTSATTAFVDLSPFLTEFSGMEILTDLLEAHVMGDTWEKWASPNLKKQSPITLGGFYDDVTSGPHTHLGQASDIGAERVIKVNFGTTNVYPKTDVIVKRYSRKPARGELTKFEVELQPTGAQTIATT
jgi:hypothetical protein